MGLNEDFKTVRGNIFMMQPFPSLSQAYRLILQEERQRDNHNHVAIDSDSIALAAAQRRFNSSGFGSYGDQNRHVNMRYSSNNGNQFNSSGAPSSGSHYGYQSSNHNASSSTGP